MNATDLPAGTISRLVEHYGDAVRPWLGRVAAVMGAAAKGWGVDVRGYHDAGWTSVVAVGASKQGRRVVIKASPDTERYQRERAALLHWADEPATRLVAFDDMGPAAPARRPRLRTAHAAFPHWPSRLIVKCEIQLTTLGVGLGLARRQSTTATVALETFMHDPRVLLDPATDAVRKLARRGYHLDVEQLEKLFSQRTATIQSTDQSRGESNRVAKEVGAAAKRGEDVTQLRDKARELKTRIQELEQQQRQCEAELQELMLSIPNLPSDELPDGDSEEFAEQVRTWGNPPVFDFEPADHVDIGERLGIFDFTRATKLSGPRFAVLKGIGAQLERALAQFFLELHTERHGYTEFSLPAIVNRPTMTGTGQLPKFEDDLFKTGVAERELFLIPTAEVPLTNLHASETLPGETLPLAYTAHTPCFRSEAGSYGKDTRGLIRLHQFAKVELVRICAPDRSRQELEVMMGHAEACLKELGLVYRVVKLAAGDASFSAQFTYDIEVWLPSQQRFREISSVSDCGTFQARRAGIRTKFKDGTRGFAATLNGSGLPIGRSLVAILEQNQQSDGSVRMPDALVPYLRFNRINPDGSVSR